MDEFPDWAKDLFKKGRNTDQVSSGLNLVLKLETPAKLPLLLWDIVAAQPKISHALRELSFVHFARFVPSYDGRALMVTTSFDGPLEPYVMDFVIALGDVFDTLLSYVDKDYRPHLPIREHPDAFWRFVRHWNRVPFGPRDGKGEAVLFPPDFNYRIYSAYPTKTVLDIDGARAELPPAVIDHPAAPVDLNDVQGNILRGYRADAAVHLFFRVVDVAAARKWLAHSLPDPADPIAAPWGSIQNAAPWGAAPAREALTNVAFTYAGMEKLLPGRKSDLQKFPTAFAQGAQQRAAENGDVGESAPEKWLFGRDEQHIHVVLSVYFKPTKAVKAAAITAPTPWFNSVWLRLQAAGEANGLQLVHQQAAQALSPEGHEHFGYRDGIAKVRIAGQCKPDEPDFQPAASPGEFLLGRDYKSIFGGSSLGDLPPDLAENGTFGALRLLEQDTALFEQTIKKGAAQPGFPNEDLLKAKLMGRWADGRPLALGASGAADSNAFDYAPSWAHPDIDNDHAGDLCPVGAHIRRVNPRTARVAGQRHSRRLIRRGMPATWVDDQEVKHHALLGLFIGASLERQFEFIQRQWIQGDLAASGIRHTQDPIAGLRDKPTDLQVGPCQTISVPPLVKTRGSLYLFFPSLSTLRNLDRAARPSLFMQVDRDTQAPDPAPAVDALLTDVSASELAGLLQMTWLPPALRELVKGLQFGESLNSTALQEFVAHFQPETAASHAPAAAMPHAAGIAPLSPRFIANPFPAYEALRAAKQAIAWIPEHQAYWVFTRAGAQQLLDPKKWVQQPSTKPLRGLLTMDDPRHAVAMPLIAQAFRAATRKLAQITDEVIDTTLVRLRQLQQFDFVQEYGNPVPRTVYWRVFGLPLEDAARCNALATTVMTHFSQPARPGSGAANASIDASVRLTAILSVHLIRAMAFHRVGKKDYADTLIGEVAAVTKPSSGGQLEFLESLMTLVQLALVHMSAQFLLGSAMRHLLTPDQRTGPGGQTPWQILADLRAKSVPQFEAALATALDEARRVDPPVTIIERFAAQDQRIEGVDVKMDCPVYAVIASANRDLPRDADPETFQFDRTPTEPHFSLGQGIHECAGRYLQAQLVTRAMTRLIAEMPSLRLCDTVSTPAWINNVYFRSLLSLPVTRCP